MKLMRCSVVYNVKSYEADALSAVYNVKSYEADALSAVYNVKSYEADALGIQSNNLVSKQRYDY